jgi:hypothetical protein
MTSFFINSGDISTETRRSGSLASHTGMSFAMDTFLLVEVNVKHKIQFILLNEKIKFFYNK